MVGGDTSLSWYYQVPLLQQNPVYPSVGSAGGLENLPQALSFGWAHGPRFFECKSPNSLLDSQGDYSKKSTLEGYAIQRLMAGVLLKFVFDFQRIYFQR